LAFVSKNGSDKLLYAVCEFKRREESLEKITPGIVLRQEDRGETDKTVTLLTPDGVIRVIMKGVKKSKAKLKFGALPFAFMEYSLTEKGGVFTVTGCTQIEDLSAVSKDIDVFYSASFLSEVAIKALDGGKVFFEFLKCLKAMLYKNANPIGVAIHFCQFVIHNSGYGYDYTKKPNEITRPIDLLYFTQKLEGIEEFQFSDDLLIRTFVAICKNFEEKFDCNLLSKKFLIKEIE